MKFNKLLSKPSKKYSPLLLLAVIILVAVVFLAISSKPKPTIANPEGISSANDYCAQKNEVTFGCYKKELTDITKKNGPEPAFTLLKQGYQTSSYIKSQCHQLVHVIGRAAYAKYGNLAQTFEHGDQFCWAGYYHGLMEQVADEEGTQTFLANINTICQPIAAKARYSFNHYNCVHGLGHGVMEALNGNLFQALTTCDGVIDSWEKTSCYGGVFMQNIMTVQSPDDTVDHKTAFLKEDQPMYPCTAVEDKYKEQCYLMQTSYALQVESYDFTKVFALCAGTPAPYKTTCYQSLGRDASGQTVSDVNGTREKCMLGSDFEAQINCIMGAARDFTAYYHSDVQAKQLCASLQVSMQATCYQTVKSYYSTF